MSAFDVSPLSFRGTNGQTHTSPGKTYDGRVPAAIASVCLK
jgi:hypothetical protein